MGLLLALWPLLQTATPPIVDYPNHLARAEILADWARFGAFEGVYERGSLILPNILADLIAIGLTPLVGPFEAGRYLLALILALVLGGAFALHAAVWKPSPWPILLVPFLYNESFFWGFLNYLLGLGLLLWGCAAWLFLERSHRRWQLLAGTLFALGSFFAHLVAFALFAVAIGLLELRRVWIGDRTTAGLGRLAASAACFLPPLAIFLLISPSGGVDLDPRFVFDAYWKLSPYTRLLASGNPIADTAMLLGVAGAVAVLLLSGRLAVHGGLILVAGAFAALALVLPHRAMGSFYLDERIPIAAAMVGLLAVHPKELTRHGAAILGIVLLGLIVHRTFVIAADWRDSGGYYAAQIEAFERLPEGGLVVAVAGVPFESRASWLETRKTHPPHEHAAHYATLVSGAVVLHLFATRGHNPVVLEPDSRILRGWTRGTIPHLPDGAALGRFTRRLTAGAAADPVFRNRPLFVAAFRLPCSAWPADTGVQPLYCGSDLSLVQVPGFPLPRDG